jgi:FkbM family methyltransferase
VSHPFVFRPDTQDEIVFHAVTTYNEYRLPDAFQPDDVIIDIGTHIGSFCYAALARGSNRVYGFEASPENFEHARRNLQSFGDRVRLYHKAVWRSDRKVERLGFSECTYNNGAGVVWKNGEGPAITAVPFDDVVREVTRNGRTRVRMVKVDCEGSEYPILLTSQTLHLIDAIVGEFHEFGPNEINGVAGHERFTIEVLQEALERSGFDVDVEHHPHYPQEPIGWWFATRKTPAPGAIPAPKLPGWARLTKKVRSLVR